MAQLVLERRQRSWLSLARRVDMVLILSTLALAAYGVVILYSATRVQLIHAGTDPHYYLKRQALYDVLGVVAMGIVVAIGYRRLVRAGLALYCLMLVMLLGVMAVGHSALGSQRWFQVGPFQLQPSAFASLGLVLALTAVIRRHESVRLRHLALLLVMAGVPIILVVKQPDLGSAIIMSVVVLTVLVVGGTRARHLLVLAVVAGAGLFLVLHLGLLKSYQLDRITGFLNQNNASTASNTTYNIAQAKAAISSGGIHGKGLFHGQETNLGYVPEQSTDFIFSAVGEQLGFVGATALLAIYGIIGWRLWRAAATAGDRTGRLCAAGALALIGYSVFQNAGMTMGIMPIAGIPLPLVSYGGSAVIETFAAVGLAISVGLARSR
ncbi:MAG: FtsW/RodA/SpoVE family cell cycle protein [Acidimicrobiales bacterium]